MNKFYFILPVVLLVVFGVYYTQIAKPEMVQKAIALEKQQEATRVAEDARRAEIEKKAQEDARKAQAERDEKERARQEKARQQKEEEERKLKDETAKYEDEANHLSKQIADMEIQITESPEPARGHEPQGLRAGQAGRTREDRPPHRRDGPPAHVRDDRAEGGRKFPRQDAARPGEVIAPKRHVFKAPALAGVFCLPGKARVAGVADPGALRVSGLSEASYNVRCAHEIRNRASERTMSRPQTDWGRGAVLRAGRRACFQYLRNARQEMRSESRRTAVPFLILLTPQSLDLSLCEYRRTT